MLWGTVVDRKSSKRTKRAFEKKLTEAALGTFRASVIAIGSATLAVVATLYFVGKLPLVDALFGTASTIQASAIQLRPSESSSAHPAPSADAAATAHPSANSPIKNLVVTKMGNLLEILNKGDAPTKVTRLVINKRAGDAICDTAAPNSQDPGGAGYVHVSDTGGFVPLPAIVKLGDSLSYLYGSCGSTAVVVEVYSDQGTAEFTF